VKDLDNQNTMSLQPSLVKGLIREEKDKQLTSPVDHTNLYAIQLQSTHSSVIYGKPSA
jgi:hypothetical protein